MDTSPQQRTRKYIAARRQNSAWLLLASPRAPLVLGCLTALFENNKTGIAEEDALQSLADMLSKYADQDEYAIDTNNTSQLAGRELRQWIKRGLVTERGQQLYATDALASAIQFVDGLDNRIMTSTASRLSVVQREIENVNVGLNPNPDARKAAIQAKIAVLEKELGKVEKGHVAVFSEQDAIERIREIYALATGLQADFRRVEDSWREADRLLRQTILSEDSHRGNIIEHLLDGQQALLNTQEGRVFDNFQQQLRESGALENMRQQLLNILAHPAAKKALNRAQLTDLRLLRMRLLHESQSVLQARARSEKDVKSFIKTGLAAEHHRVGQLLNEVLNVAQALDWQRQNVRRSSSPLPPIGFALGNLPVIERLRFKTLEQESQYDLDLSQQENSLRGVGEEFWESLDGLDREAMIADTLATLARKARPLTLVELAAELPTTHDLEALALWLGMAREAGIEIIQDQKQTIEWVDEEQQRWRFHVPKVAITQAALDGIDWEF